jgi:hypothetical protein
MKKLLLLSIILTLFTITLKSQDTVTVSKKHNEYRSLLGNHHEGGFYGAFNIGYSKIDDKDAIVMGGRFSWVINHGIAIGFGGQGFVNEIQNVGVQNQIFLTGGYGGIYIEPILMPNFPVHLSFPVLVGAGGISYVQSDVNWNNFIEDTEAFLIVEPTAELELNLTRFFRMSFGASYRFPTPFNVGTTGSSATAESLQGFTYTMTFKFGRF